MNKKLRHPASTLLYFVALSSCASNTGKPKYVPPTQANQKLSTWDYDKIRQARETEDSMTLHESAPTENDLKNCVIMSAAEMTRGKVTGCRPVDPRAGNGENSYCCPRQAESKEE